LHLSGWVTWIYLLLVWTPLCIVYGQNVCMHICMKPHMQWVNAHDLPLTCRRTSVKHLRNCRYRHNGSSDESSPVTDCWNQLTLEIPPMLCEWVALHLSSDLLLQQRLANLCGSEKYKLLVVTAVCSPKDTWQRQQNSCQVSFPCSCNMLRATGLWIITPCDYYNYTPLLMSVYWDRKHGIDKIASFLAW